MSNKAGRRAHEDPAARQARIRKKLAEMDALAAVPAPATPDATPTPVRKPWQNSSGQQIRPLTRKEREHEELEQFLAKAVKAHEDFRQDAQRSQDVAQKAAKKEQLRQQRTGTRPLPNRDGGYSVEETQKRDYIGSDGDTPDDNQNPNDNSRHDFTKFGR